MKIQYKTVLLFVKDVQASCRFYETNLQQKVEYDFGEDIEFEDGLAIHNAGHISKLLFNRSADEKPGKNNFEIYFECDDLEAAYSRLDGKAVFLHGIKEQSWGTSMPLEEINGIKADSGS
jgi:predicted enzyme related to lactoylglutathione lyase